MNLRLIAQRLHRWCGFVLVLFLLNAGLTGTALVFRHELDDALNADAVRVEPAGPPLTSAAMAAAVLRDRPGMRVERFVIGANEQQAWQFRLVSSATGGAIEEVWVNPYTGAVTGERDPDLLRLDRRHFMSVVWRLHNSLLLGAAGKTVVGAIALVWLLSSFIGIYLALPKGRGLLKALSVKRDGNAYKKVYDWHRVAGLVTSLVLLGSSFSAMQLAQPVQFKSVVDVVSRTSMPLPASLPDKRQGAPAIDTSRAIALARDELPGVDITGVVAFPDKGAYLVRYRLPGDIAATHGTGRMFVDMMTGRIIANQNFRNQQSFGDALLVWMYPLHTGQAFGMPGRLAILAVGLFPAFLGLSALWLWWRRRTIQQGRMRRADCPPPRPGGSRPSA